MMPRFALALQERVAFSRGVEKEAIRAEQDFRKGVMERFDAVNRAHKDIKEVTDKLEKKLEKLTKES